MSQDLKLPMTIFRPFGAPCVLTITEKKDPDMNAPTPREQELEAQNKALWELVWKADDALQGMVSLITVNTVAGGKIPSIFADDTRVAWAIEARAAIQKAKEAR